VALSRPFSSAQPAIWSSFCRCRGSRGKHCAPIRASKPPASR